jgi:hypothetical protein
VAEVRLGGLGVIVAAVAHRPAGCANSQTAAVELVAGAVAELGGLVDQLVEGGEDVV